MILTWSSAFSALSTTLILQFGLADMRSALLALAAALSATQVKAHATFQELWVNGVDQGQTCVRLPNSNNPLTDVSANSIRCNVNQGAVSGCCINTNDHFGR